MIRISLDLEMNEGDNKSIIQIGACIFNTETAEILDTFDQIIIQDEEITSYITNLTKITQEKVNNGKSLNESYWDLVSFSNRLECQKFPIVTWGSGDLQLLKKQLNLSESEWKLGRNELNVKSIYQAYCDANGLSLQGGLKRSSHNIGLKFSGPAHNALQDSIGAAKMYCKLLDLLRFPKQT